MLFALKSSVGVRLALTIFLVIALSWILSAGTASYIAYERMQALREEMLRRPDLYPVPIPEPRFGIMDFLIGPRPELGLPRPEPRPPMGDLRPGPPPIPPGNLPPSPMPGPPPNNQPGFSPGRPPNPIPLNGPPPGQVVGPGLGPRPDQPPPIGPGPTPILVTRTAIAVLLAVLAGAWLSAGFTKKLLRLARGASAFNEGNFSYRIADMGEDEFAQVGATMNSMAARVAQQVSRLEDDAKRRRQLLADVAHELRGPVATLRTMAGALQDGVANDSERRERAIDSLVRTSDRLLRLVTDLLELARLDLHELPIHPRLTDLRELAATSIELHSASAAQAGITLRPIDEGEPVMAYADPSRVSQALDNLLDNSISYAGAGSEVSIMLEDSINPRIIVSDNGRGIAAAHLPYIFDSFYRTDKARTLEKGHSGLGLRISRALIEAQDGTLIITSGEGAGTVAVITLPRDARSV